LISVATSATDVETLGPSNSAIRHLMPSGCLRYHRPHFREIQFIQTLGYSKFSNRIWHLECLYSLIVFEMGIANYLMSIEVLEVLEFENKLDEFIESLSLAHLTTDTEYLSLGWHVTSPEGHNSNDTMIE
jgi:hypothetical protein